MHVDVLLAVTYCAGVVSESFDSLGSSAYVWHTSLILDGGVLFPEAEPTNRCSEWFLALVSWDGALQACAWALACLCGGLSPLVGFGACGFSCAGQGFQECWFHR